MKPTTRTWTGIAVLTFALTIVEIAAVSQVVRGADLWWGGDQARALRTAGTLVGEMVTDRISGRGAAPIGAELASLGTALAPLACGHCGDHDAMRVVILDTRDEEKRVLRQIRRVELREALRKLERQTL